LFLGFSKLPKITKKIIFPWFIGLLLIKKKPRFRKPMKHGISRFFSLPTSQLAKLTQKKFLSIFSSLSRHLSRKITDQVNLSPKHSA
jgi:hypothetical protein